MTLEEIKQAYKEQKYITRWYGKFGHNFDFYLGKHNYLLESLIFTHLSNSYIKHSLLKDNEEYLFKANYDDKEKIKSFEPNWKNNICCMKDYMIDNMKSYFHFFDWQITTITLKYPDIALYKKIEDNHFCLFYILIPNNEFSIRKLIKIMDLFGYYNSQRIEAKDCDMIDLELSQYFDDWSVLTFEPHFQDTVNNIISNCKYLYHVSPSYCDKKIKKYGLIPKSKNKAFDYPDRIYVFADTTLSEIDNEFKIFMNETMDGNIPYYNYIGKKFMETRLSDGITDEMSYRNEFEYSLWQIDNSKINNVFFIDYNLTPFAIYTTENISPNYITKIKSITYR